MKINTIIILTFALSFLVACSKKKTDPVPVIKTPSVTIDLGFGIDGIVFLPGVISGRIDLLTDKKIMLTNHFENENVSFVRLSVNGSSDNAFANWGKLEFIADPLTVDLFQVQSNGKIWKFLMEEGQVLQVDRYHVNGESDLSFSGADVFKNVVQLPDNSVLINKTSNFQKLLENGSLDNSFANGGMSDNISNGIVSALYYKENVYIKVGQQGIALRKMSASGEYKSDFGNNGSVVNYELNSTNFNYKIFNDFLYVYYSYFDETMNSHGTLIKRYDLEGKADLNFGVNGEVRIPPLEQGHSDFAMSLEVSANGDIYVFGSQSFTNTFLYKLNNAGQKEASFGENGLLSIDIISNALDMKINANELYLLGTEKDINNPYGFSTGSSLLIKYQIE